MSVEEAVDRGREGKTSAIWRRVAWHSQGSRIGTLRGEELLDAHQSAEKADRL